MHCPFESLTKWYGAKQKKHPILMPNILYNMTIYKDIIELECIGKLKLW